MRAPSLVAAILIVSVALCGALPAAAGQRGLRIAVFREPGFPAIGMPQAVTPEWIARALASAHDVTFIDSRSLADVAQLSPQRFDVLVMAYGEAFPRDAFPAIRAFLEQGGGFLHCSGRPFAQPQSLQANVWRASDQVDPYKEFLAPLGIKPHEDEQELGLTVTTSVGGMPILPTHGNVFPYRVPAREFYLPQEYKNQPQFRGSVLARAWRNPYGGESLSPLRAWWLISASDRSHPFFKADTKAAQQLQKMMNYLSAGLVLHEVETEFASYQPGERVVLSGVVTNTGSRVSRGRVELEIRTAAGACRVKKQQRVSLPAGATTRVSFRWQPRADAGSFYTVRMVLRQASGIAQEMTNGFAISSPQAYACGPRISAQGNQLLLNDVPQFMWGTNYYESRQGELMWIRPDLGAIRADFQRMQQAGLRLVRIHYHHSKWFRDYYQDVLRQPLDSYLALADESALPSERSLRILDAVIQLSQECGLVICLDLFTLVPREMGDPRGWLGMRERIVEEPRVVWQEKFLKRIAERYRAVPGIIWDLWNEPRLARDDEDTLRQWAQRHKNTLRASGDSHLVTIGDPLSLRLIDVLDYASLHTDTIRSFGNVGGYARPVMFGEVWNPSGSSEPEEARQRDKLVQDARESLASGAAGFMPWQWTRQARLWHNASDAERWDDELGCCVREDGSLKPAGRAYQELIRAAPQPVAGKNP